MKRQVSFTDEAEAYRFTPQYKEDGAFEIRKDTLVFNSNDFYQLFFKGLDAKPEYEVVNSGAELKGQAKHVFDTVSDIFKKACDSIDDAWFSKTKESAAEAHDVFKDIDS